MACIMAAWPAVHGNNGRKIHSSCMTFLVSNDARRRRRNTFACILISTTICLLFHAVLEVHAEPSTIPRSPTTIPRSNNRYTHFNEESSSHSASLSDISSPWSPPWNPSSKIDPSGYLAECYLRTPGEWEAVA